MAPKMLAWIDLNTLSYLLKVSITDQFTKTISDYTNALPLKGSNILLYHTKAICSAPASTLSPRYWRSHILVNLNIRS